VFERNRGRRYLTLDQVHERYGGTYSKWTLREKARRGLIPHLVHPGGGRILFSAEDLDAFDGGAELESIVLRPPRKDVRPGRLVRPAPRRQARA
jgi:hypothetical protein